MTILGEIESNHTMDTWIVYALQITVVVIAIIWLLMLVGAWVNALQKAHPLLQWIELSDEHARPIMRAMVRELITLVVAIAAAVITIVAVLPGRKKVETISANLLCQVYGTKTSSSVVSSLKELGEVPTSLQQSVQLASALLGEVAVPITNKTLYINVNGLERRVPSRKRNVFDLRMLGLAYDLLGTKTKDPTVAQRYFTNALGFYQSAWQKSKDGLPGPPNDDFRDRFLARLEASIAGVEFSLALVARNKDERERLLQGAATKYEGLKDQYGDQTIFFTNLTMIYAQRNAFDEAIRTIREIGNSRLASDEKRRAVEILANVDDNPELVPLLTHVTNVLQKPYGPAYLFSLIGMEQ